MHHLVEMQSFDKVGFHRCIYGRLENTVWDLRFSWRKVGENG